MRLLRLTTSLASNIGEFKQADRNVVCRGCREGGLWLRLCHHLNAGVGRRKHSSNRWRWGLLVGQKCMRGHSCTKLATIAPRLRACHMKQHNLPSPMLAGPLSTAVASDSVSTLASTIPMCVGRMGERRSTAQRQRVLLHDRAKACLAIAPEPMIMHTILCPATLSGRISTCKNAHP